MRQLLSLLLLFCTTVGLSSAIRGERRRLQVPQQPKDKAIKCRPLPKDGMDPISIPPLASKTPALPTLSPSKFLDVSDSPTSSPSKLLLPKAGLATTTAPTMALPYCTDPPTPLPKAGPLPKAAKADCVALAKGVLPQSFDGSVTGYLKVDLSYDVSPETVLVHVSDVLQQETSAAVAGCSEPPAPLPPHRRLQNGTLVTSGVNGTTTATILGVNFSDISIGGVCTPVNTSLNCSEVTCNVAILYDGEANATEMLELLQEEIETQATQGAFNSVGQVSNVTTSPDATASTREQNSKTGSTIIVVGAVAGVAAIIGVLLAGYKYANRSSRARSFDGEPAWTGVVAVAEAVQDSVETSVVKVTGKAI